MNLLITGGLGHIGTYFLSRSHELKKIKNIYVLDKIEEKILVLVNLKLKRKINFINIDLSEEIIKFKDKKKFDIVIHLASTTNAEASVKNKKKVFKNNLGCFKNILNFCLKNKIKLIHLSSTSVYGSQDLFVDEDCKELLPQSPYAEVKIIEEKILKKTNKNFKFVTLRLGTIVGPSSGMRFHTAVNKFCMQSYLNQPLDVWKTAYNQFRPYLSIRDSFKVFNFFIENKIFDREVYNVVSENLTVKNIVDRIKKFNKTKIRLVNSKIMNQLSYKVNTAKVNKIGLKTKSTLIDDINNTFKLLNKKL